MPQNKLKIAFLQRGNDPYTDERIRFLNSKGHFIYSISFYPVEEKNKIKGVQYVQMRNLTIDKIPFVKRFSHYFELRRILTSIKPDIFHVVSALNLFYINYDLPVKMIVENQGSDLILTPQKNKFLIPFYRKYFKKANAVIQDSYLLLEKSIEYGATKKNGLNRVIGIGIDFSIFNPTIEKNIIRNKFNLEDKIILLHTRGNAPLYNIDILLSSLRIIINERKDVILILTTTFDELNLRCKLLIRENNLLSHIVFVGYQDRQVLKYFYTDADLLISIPSSDSSPFSVYESMACLTPVIVSDLPWLYSRFSPGRHLITVPIGNSNMLARAVIDYFSNAKKQIDLQESYKIIFKEINLDIENQKLEVLYSDTISN